MFDKNSGGSMKLPKSFDLHIKKQENGCWIWTGPERCGGYGNHRGIGAHVIAYTRAYGPVPSRMDVGHLCGVRLCVNPDHLKAMTRTENNRMKSNFKLTEANVREIREELAKGKSRSVLAHQYKVSKSMITHIKMGREWKEKSKHVQR